MKRRSATVILKTSPILVSVRILTPILQRLSLHCTVSVSASLITLVSPAQVCWLCGMTGAIMDWQSWRERTWKEKARLDSQNIPARSDVKDSPRQCAGGTVECARAPKGVWAGRGQAEPWVGWSEHSRDGTECLLPALFSDEATGCSYCLTYKQPVMVPVISGLGLF